MLALYQTRYARKRTRATFAPPCADQWAPPRPQGRGSHPCTRGRAEPCTLSILTDAFTGAHGEKGKGEKEVRREKGDVGANFAPTPLRQGFAPLHPRQGALPRARPADSPVKAEKCRSIKDGEDEVGDVGATS